MVFTLVAGTSLTGFAVQLTLSSEENQEHCTEQGLPYQAITTTVSNMPV